MYITVALYNNTIHVCDLRCQEELLLLSNERLEVHRHIYIYTQTYIYTHISISISISIYPSIYITVALYIGMLPAWPEGTAAAFRSASRRQSLYIYIYIPIYIYLCLSIYIYTHIYICIYIHLFIYITVALLPAWPEGTAAAFR